MSVQTEIVEALAEDLREHLRGKQFIEVKEPPDGPPELAISWHDGGLITLKHVGNKLIVTNDLEWAGEIPVFDLDDPTALERARDYVSHQNRIKHLRRAMGMWKDRDDIIDIDELRPDRYQGPDQPD
jgi:hypothetical protein